MPDEILDKAAQNGKYFEVGHLADRFQNVYYTAAMPFYANSGKIAGYVFISSPTSLLQGMWSELSTIYLFCTALPILLMFIILYFLTRRITRPVNLMSEAAVNMSKGDFSKRIPVMGDDEIGDLAKAFNAMSN